MTRKGILLGLLLAGAACSDDRDGKGGGDRKAPKLEVTVPEGWHPRLVTLEGKATDGVGVTSLAWSLDGGEEVPVEIEPGRSATFTFDVRAEPGIHELVVLARDAAGNVGRSLVGLQVAAPAVIEAFDVEPPSARRGEPVTVRWEVSGSGPVTVLLDGEPTTETQFSFNAAQDRTFRLEAEGVGGNSRAFARFRLEPEPLLVVPGSGVVLPGTRQRFWATVSPQTGVEWTATGGTLNQWGLPTADWFSPTTPGTYEIEARTGESTQRVATATVEVREIAPSIVGFEGLGGQPGQADVLAADAAGNLWSATANSFAPRVAHLPAGSTQWRFLAEGLLASPDLLAATAGRLYTGDFNRLSTISVGSSAFEAIDWPPGEALGELVSGLDGKAYAVSVATGDRSVRVHQLAGTTRTLRGEPLFLDDTFLLHVGAAADGTIFLASRDGVRSLAPGSERWTDLGTPEGFLAADLAVDGDGVPWIAGDGVFRGSAAGWEQVDEGLGPSPSVQALRWSPTGVMIASSRGRFYASDGTGSFIEVAGLGPWEAMGDAPPIPSFAVDGAGTLYVPSLDGVHRQAVGEDAWVAAGPPSGMGTFMATSLTLPWSTTEGPWTLVMQVQQPMALSTRLIGRPSDGGEWVFLDELYQLGSSASAIFGAHGELYLVGRSRTLRIDPDGTETALPLLPEDFLTSPQGLSASPQGRLFAGGNLGAIFCLEPGASSWTWIDDEGQGLVVAGEDEDGDLWALSNWSGLHRMRLGAESPSWEPFTASNLPEDLDPDVLLVTPDGEVWVAGFDGVFRFDRAQERFELVGTNIPQFTSRLAVSPGGRVALAGEQDSWVFVSELDRESGAWVPVYRDFLWGSDPDHERSAGLPPGEMASSLGYSASGELHVGMMFSGLYRSQR